MVLLCGEGTSTVSRTCEKLTELSTTTKNECFSLKSGVKFVQFVRICPKSATFSPNSCSSRPTFTKLSSVLQRFQPVNSIQDFLPPYGNEGRVFSAFLKLPVFACED